MKRNSKLATTISIAMIAFGIFMFLLIHPFLYIYIGLIEQGKTNVHNTKWDKLAVKYSIFKAQKIYTIESALAGLYISKDYETAIAYINELERLNLDDDLHRSLASYIYFKKGDMAKSLEYAKASDNKKQMAKIYIATNDIKNAEILVNELLKDTPITVTTMLRKAELEIAKGNWTIADSYIDKALKVSSNNRDVMRTKIKILNHYGKFQESKKYQNKIDELDKKYSKRIK